MLYYTQLQYLYLNSQNHVNFRCVNMPQIKGSSQRMKHNKNKKMGEEYFVDKLSFLKNLLQKIV